MTLCESKSSLFKFHTEWDLTINQVLWKADNDKGFIK